MLLTNRDALMSYTFFLIGALIAVLFKLWGTEEPTAVFVFGPGTSEPERSACEAREIKRREEISG